jgi:hypothetical protein
MSQNKIFKKGDLVTYRTLTHVRDDQTDELIEYKEFRGIGIIIDDTHEEFGWVKVWFREHPHISLDTEFLTIHLEHYKI